jgi:hypothetical protein
MPRARLILWLWAIAPVPEIGVECGEILCAPWGEAPEVVGQHARTLPITGAALAPAMEELRLVMLSAEEALSRLAPRERLRVLA